MYYLYVSTTVLTAVYLCIDIIQNIQERLPFIIYSGLSDDGQQLVVRAKEDKHENHKISEVLPACI